MLRPCLALHWGGHATRCGATRLLRPLTLAHELVHTALAQPHVDVTAGVDPAAMSGATTIKTSQHCTLAVQHTDAGRRAPCPALADVEDPLLVHGDVHRLLEVGPHGDVLPIRSKDLDAMILPVTHIDASVMYQQTVG